LTVRSDTTAPTGQSAALSGGPWYTALSVPLTLANGTDGEAGLDTSSGVVERDSAPLVAGNCDSFSGSWTQVALVAGADTTVLSGNCYRYRYRISDRVGNASAPSTPSAVAEIDTSAPSIAVGAPTAQSGAGAQWYDAGAQKLWFRPS